MDNKQPNQKGGNFWNSRSGKTANNNSKAFVQGLEKAVKQFLIVKKVKK